MRKSLSLCGNVRQRRIRGFPHMLVGYLRVSSADQRQSVNLQRGHVLSRINDYKITRIAKLLPGRAAAA